MDMKLKKNVAVSENGFVFNAARGESFTTNTIGTDILHLLQDGHSQEEIQAAILEEYEIDKATCEKDLYDFMKMLHQHNLLTQ